MLDVTYISIFTLLQYALKQRQVANNIKEVLKHSNEVDGYSLICHKHANLFPPSMINLLMAYEKDDVNLILMEILRAEKKWPCQ